MHFKCKDTEKQVEKDIATWPQYKIQTKTIKENYRSILLRPHICKMVNKIQYWHKDRWIEQWSRTKARKKQTYTYVINWLFWTSYQNNAMGIKIVFSTNWAETNIYPYRKKNKSWPDIELTIKAKTIKQENRRIPLWL